MTVTGSSVVKARLSGLAAHHRGDAARTEWCVPVRRTHHADTHAAYVDGVFQRVRSRVRILL